MSSEPDREPRSRRRQSVARRALRAAAALLALVVVIASVALAWGYLALRASLPRIEGELVLDGLSAPVTVERDDHGVPTVRGTSRLDVARATGFLHAQERFFQMDAMRRQAAGELAELFGPAAVDHDRRTRIHRFRLRAGKVISAAAPDERAVVESYAAGVNAGLAALGSRPFEYHLLRAEPAAWVPEDTVLVLFSMFLTLHDSEGEGESDLGLLRDTLPDPMFAFLAPTGTEWDAPLVGGTFETPPVPGPDVLDLREAGELPEVARREWNEEPLVGSNNWAVAGTHAAFGRALLANDMHLPIQVPNTWYRASLEWSSERIGEPVRVTGVTLPGSPGVVAGSNGHVAWGFTNSQGDWFDLVLVEKDSTDPELYRTADGWRRLERHVERVRVKGQPDQSVEILETAWGPIVDRDHLGRPRALRWIAHDREAVNLRLARLDQARTVDQALDEAAQIGIPPQNFVCADSSGRIGWTIIGRIPRRVGFTGRLPGSWADGSRRWVGYLPPEEYPRVLDPPRGRLWTANARTVDGDMLARLGEGGYDLGARARQIRDDLLAIEKATVEDMLSVQLDDRAVFLERWQRLLLETLDPQTIAQSAARAKLRLEVEGWGGRAAVDSVGYRVVRGFRLAVAELVFEPLTAACRRRDPDFEYGQTHQYEGPLWRLVSERPAHLLNPRFRTWDEVLRAAIDDVLEELTADGSPLEERRWGQANTTAIQHPLSQVVPWLGRFLDMPRTPLPGDSNMPRVQRTVHGASERFVVSPGHEEDGVFHMPGGQSGHPLSPYYREGHTDWELGRPTPFLPGPAAHVLRLVPGSGSR
jgi:penicillin G amidase